MNLETDWIKYEEIGGDIYYGYTTNLTADEDSRNWSIRKLIGTGSTTTRWSNDKIFQYTSVWTNKEDYFTSPSSTTWSGITWSYLNSNNTFNIIKSIVKIEWEPISGVDVYQMNITDTKGVVYNHLNLPLLNPYMLDKITSTVIPKNTGNVSYVFKGTPGEIQELSATWSSVFTDGVYVIKHSSDDGRGAEFQLNVENGGVSHIDIIQRGMNYTIGDVFLVDNVPTQSGTASIIEVSVDDLISYNVQVKCVNGFGFQSETVNLYL